MAEVIRVFDEACSGHAERLFDELERKNPGSYAVKLRRRAQTTIRAERMHASIVGIIAASLLPLGFTGAMAAYQCPRRVDFHEFGRKRCELFVTIDDMDTSLRPLTSLFIRQAFSSLCDAADHGSPDGRLAVPVRLMLDDFANLNVANFDNILSVTRFCDEGVVIEKSDEVVEEIVGSAIRRFRKNCDTDIPITVSKPEEILLAPMDATLIEQVLLNLLENVAKHSPSATEVFIEIRAEGRRVWLTVADNGDGIPPQLLGVLFDGYLPLGAVEASDRSRHMGIGLSVCRAIVRAHGGEIYARNKIDSGAEFRFWLPAEEESNT